MSRLRVAIVADYLEEGWPSMDLIAEMLLDRLQREHSGTVDATLIRPSFIRRAARVPGLRLNAKAHGLDRLANRMHDYPRELSKVRDRFDVFHLVDHSYSQLVHELPPERTLVTCHDLDTFRCLSDDGTEARSGMFRAMTRRILGGLQKAGHVACDTQATRDALVSKLGIPEVKTSVVHNGPHPSCSPEPQAAADFDAARLLGSRGAFVELLHVGSAIPRKRLDFLLTVFADVRACHANVRLTRAGGSFTAEQSSLARRLNVLDAVVVLPRLDRETLAAVYRRSTLLLMTSEREGFGLPVLEALASGTPVVCSDIPALREVAGFAATYCQLDNDDEWRDSILRLIEERRSQPAQWNLRREAGLRRAGAFSWSHYTRQVVQLYTRMVENSPSPC